MHWLLLGTCFTAFGCSIAYWIPFNKRLWSPSYSLVTTGTGICMYAALFFLCDWEAVSPCAERILRVGSTALKPFQWLGSNCILFFVLSECCGVLSWCLQTVRWGKPGNSQNIVGWFHDHFLWQSCGLGNGCPSSQSSCAPVEVAFTLVGLVFWILVCGVLHRWGIFWKI